MTGRVRSLLWIALVIAPVTVHAGIPVPGPPSTGYRDLIIAAVLFFAGLIGVGVVPLVRRGALPEAQPFLKKLQLVFWLMVIGGVPAISAVLTFLESRERHKVIQTMSDMRRIATAWEERANELQRYNAAGAGITFTVERETVPRVLPHTITSEQAAALLVPKYLNSFPMLDGWGNSWLLAIDQPLPGSADAPAVHYAIASPGKGGVFGPPVNGNVPCAAWECDIVFSDGGFITRFPADDAHDVASLLPGHTLARLADP